MTHTVDLLLHLMGDERNAQAQTELIAHTGTEVEYTAAIDFSGHRRNFEDTLVAFRERASPMVDGREGCRAVALIRDIFAVAERASG
ncbi:MAG: hypothetical protein VX340_01790 [Pseudomonadota bacterium]|nr:hypothetical protein [Pseudomonadota bacterium]